MPLTWDEIKALKPSEPVLVVEANATKVRNIKGEMVPMARARRRANGLRGDGYRKHFQPRTSPKALYIGKSAEQKLAERAHRLAVRELARQSKP